MFFSHYYFFKCQFKNAEIILFRIIHQLLAALKNGILVISLIKGYSEIYQTSMKELFCENSLCLMAVKRSSHQSAYCKKAFLIIFLQNLQGNTWASVSFLIKLQALPATLLKKRLWRRSFPVNTFFYRTPPVAASVLFRKAPSLYCIFDFVLNTSLNINQNFEDNRFWIWNWIIVLMITC